MLTTLRVYGLLLALAPLPAFAADSKAQPVTPPVAAPAFLDVVSFAVQADGEHHKMIVISAPGALRVDEPEDGYSVIYHPQTDQYTGLEHRNDTYWEFSWPEVRDAVMASKRYEAHLQDLGNLGISDENAPTTNNPTASALPDNAGYVWRQTNDKKNIAGLDCVRWVGETVGGESIEAWCFNGLLPKVQAAMNQLRIINEPMALVPIRTLVPPLVFPVYDALARGGVTPVLINWGGDQEKDQFAWLETKTRPGDLRLFTVPKLYLKTTLISMDGMIEQNK